MFPPVFIVAVFVELSTAIVESVGDLVADDVADGAVIQVVRSVLVKEDALQNAGGELDLLNERSVVQWFRVMRRHEEEEKINQVNHLN